MPRPDDFSGMTVNLPDDVMEEYDEMASSKSGTARMLITTWMDAVEEHDLKETPEAMNIAILHAYKNSIEKHIESLKSQRDDIQKVIDTLEDDDEDDEFLFEVELKMNRKSL
jgi:metal-responsive CopG/Arc/MetJ family transcriptional regulator